MECKCNESLMTVCGWLNFEQMEDTSVLITGGTGLVGYNVIRELVKLKETIHFEILALVRNINKAKIVFGDFLNQVTLIQGDVLGVPKIEQKVDYIIHGASVTSSRTFVEQPVETIMTSVMGARNMLELAKAKKVRSMVYLSSMEVYGSCLEDKILSEEAVHYLDPMVVRSSYPESKRMCETLCVAYAKEYGVDVKIARLAQTFGPGIQPGDQRAVVQFVTSALNHRDIEIKASGESARMYLYTFDAVTALMTILLKGQSGRAYNVANSESYCSIRCLAQQIIELFSPDNRVWVNTGSAEERAIYPPDSFLRLDTSRLEALGWRPCISLPESLMRLAQALEGTGN